MPDPTMPDPIRAWTRARNWGAHHLEWHTVRRWDRLAPGERRAAERQGWRRHPVQEGAAGNGLEFLVMHRAMIELLRDTFPADADLFAGWATVPTDPADKDDPVPAGDPFDPDPLAGVAAIQSAPAALGDDDAFGLFVQTRARPTPGDPFARSADPRAGVHNYLHNRFSDPASPVDLGRPEVNLENARFWRLHGWIDARWSAGRAARGLSDADPALRALVDAAKSHLAGHAHAGAAPAAAPPALADLPAGITHPFRPSLAGAFHELTTTTPRPQTPAELAEYLQMAVRLEHFTLPLYLTAYWSLDPGAAGPQAEILLSVAMEEMLHLGLVCNLLAGLGQVPRIATPDAVPRYPAVMPGVESAAPFRPEAYSDAQVRRFLEIETPQHGAIPDAALAAVPEFKTIGDFYDAIDAALVALNPAFVTDRQVPASIDGEELFVIQSVADARRAVRLIKEQGEGTTATQGVPSTPGELAHYYRFNQLLRRVRYAEQPDGTWKLDPGQPLPAPPAEAVSPMAPVPDGGYPGVPAVAAFDRAYSDVLADLQAAWSAPAGRARLRQAVARMRALTGLARGLMATPRDPAFGPGNYGPTFRFDPSPAAPPAPPPPAPHVPSAATGYARVRQILDAAVGGDDIGSHGAFWRTLDRDAFVAHKVFGRPLLAENADGSFDPDESNLVKALEGRAPFGKDLDPPPGATLRRMPAGYPPVPPAQIAEIRDWLAAGAPAGDPPAAGVAPGGPADQVRIDVRWADADERAAVERAVRDAGGTLVHAFSGFSTVQVARDALPTLVASGKVSFTLSHSTPADPPAGLVPPGPVVPPAEAERVTRDFAGRAAAMAGPVWEEVRDRVTRAEAAGGAVPAAADRESTDAYLIQLVGPLRPAWREELTRFGAVLPHAPPDTFRMLLSAADVDHVRHLPFVGRVARYAVGDTLTPAMLTFLDTVARDTPDQEVAFDVIMHRPSPGQGCRVKKMLDDDPRARVEFEGDVAIRFRAPAGSPVVSAVAHMPEVKTIAPYTPPKLALDQAVKLVGADAVGAAAAGGPAAWTGAGEVVAVFDSGVDPTHPDLAPALAPPPTSYGHGTVGDAHGHGTHVVGIIAGRGVASGRQVRGVAPGASVYSVGICDQNGIPDIPTDLRVLLGMAVKPEVGAKIINLSWRAKLDPDYGVYGEGIDRFVWDNPDVLVIVAAGNDGQAGTDDGKPEHRGRHLPQTIGSPAVGKNVLTVGACRNVRPGCVTKFGERSFPHPPAAAEPLAAPPPGPAAFSSRGPTKFLSAKPDLLAPGTMVLSTLAATATIAFEDFAPPAPPPAPPWAAQYAYLCGTSMAAPVVAGAAAVVREYLRKERGVSAPSAALLKALLVLAARPVNKASANSVMNDPRIGTPDFDQGFGVLDLRHVLPYPDDPKAPPGRGLAFADVPNNDAQALEARQPDGGPRRSYRTYTLTVPPAAAALDLRVALVWTDPPGRGVQNRMSLRVRLPNQTSVYGNQDHKIFADPVALAVGAPVLDPNNNVLVAVVEAAAAGTYRITVTAESTAYPYQGYALAVLGPVANGPLTPDP